MAVCFLDRMMKKRKNIKRKNTRRKSGNTRLKRKTRITKRSKCILAVLCAVLLVVTTAFAIAQDNKPRRSPNVLLNMDKDVVCGVDLSHFNGEVDFEALKSEVDFVILRVGYTGYSNGKINADDNFREYIKAANDVGLPVGVYYYSQATNKLEAKAEAKFVLRHIKKYDVSLPVFFDFEFAEKDGERVGRLHKAGLNAMENTEIVNEFCKIIADEGYDYGVYASSSVLSNELNTNELDKNAYIWVADYNKKVTYSGKYNLWQYSNTGRFDAVSNGERDVDLNYWYIK